MSNSRFAEYVTSGAFTLTLSRHQISALSLTVGGEKMCFDGSLSALERKGLIEAFARQHGCKPDAPLTDDKPRGRSGTAREAPSTVSEREEQSSAVGAQPAARHEFTEAPTATAETGPSRPAPAKASDLPGGEASPGGATVNPSGPAEIIREEGESGAPQISDPEILRLADDGCPHAEPCPRMVQIGPGQFVNERSARALGLVRE